MPALRSIPTSVWSSSDFDCEKVFNENFSNAESFEEIQDEIMTLLDENTAFFNKHCANLIKNHSNINSSLADLSTIFELENEKIEGNLERAKGFTSELERVAGDIIKLARERRELTISITNKRQLQMIQNGIERIEELLGGSKQLKIDFKEISNLLLATEQLLSQFKVNNETGFEFDKLILRFDDQKRRLSRQVLETFDRSIDETGKLLLDDPTELFGCCLSADVLENNLRSEIIKIYLEKQFRAYRLLHPISTNVLDLKTLDKRFKWSQRMLNFYDKTFKLTFPSEWQVEILLGQAMGNWIKEDIVGILSAVPPDRRVSEDIFTQALSEANSFDRYITLRFKNTFTSTVTQAFQDFHYFLFEAKEDEFNALKKQILPKDSVKSINKILKKDQLVIANFDQFFLFFSNVLDTFVHLSSMSSGVLLVQFSFFLSDCLESLNQYIESQFELITTLPSKKWTEDVGRLLCCLLNTLDYCLTNIQDQTERILSQIRSEDLKLQVSLESAQQKILVNQSIGMSALMTRYDNDLQPAIHQYTKTDWEQISGPTDPSPFYLKIVEILEQGTKFPLPQVIKTLQPQTCRIFLEKFINGFMLKLQNCLFKFKFVNEIAAEQLMIDLFDFRSYFQQRLVPSAWKAKELAIWSQVVVKATNNYELHLKVMLTPTYPVAPFVQSYLLLLTNFNSENFTRFLEIKGISKRSEQQIFMEEFYKHVPPTPQELNDDSTENNNHNNNNSFFLTQSPTSGSLFSRLKSSLNVVNVIKRSYTRPKSDKLANSK